MLRVIDRWTTRDGEWYPSSKPYAIPTAMLDKYGGEPIPGKGGATHIFVKAPKGSFVVEFNTVDGRNRLEMLVPDSGWVSMAMFHSSSYDPDSNVGPWLVRVDGEKVAEGIGLPNSWHVSTFLVVGEAGDAPVPVPTPTPGRDKVRLYVNDELVWSN